jgi:enterochelin esterase family protein
MPVSPRIDRLYDAFRIEGHDAVETFWKDVTASGTPLVEPLDEERVLVTFLWRGSAESTTIGWELNLPLERFEQTDLWYGTQVLPADLRTVYYIRHGDADSTPHDTAGEGPSHIDALNPRQFQFPRDPADDTDWDTWLSVLELPAAPLESWSTRRPDVPHGELTDETLESEAFGAPRAVSVYCPPGIPTEGLGMLVVFDGYLGRTTLRMDTTLDNLIAAGEIPPMVALFVGQVATRRLEELSPNQQMADFVTQELVPWARRRWGLSDNPGDCIITGSSLGGLTAAYIALQAPEVFGAVISQSGSFWWPKPQAGEPELLIREYTNQPRKPLRFYLDVGNRETQVYDDGVADQLSTNRRMRDALQDRGYPVTYAEFTGGHDYINWRRTFANGLLAVTPGDR